MKKEVLYPWLNKKTVSHFRNSSQLSDAEKMKENSETKPENHIVVDRYRTSILLHLKLA